MSQEIEQYRPGFEAAHPHFALQRNTTDGKYCAWVEDRWQGWLAAKREVSTEPSAKAGPDGAGQMPSGSAETRMDAGFKVLAEAGPNSVETLDEKAENALLWFYRRMKNSYGRLPFIEEAVSGLRARRTGALADDAKDAARLKVFIDWYLREGARSEVHMYGHMMPTTREIVLQWLDREAHTKAGSGK